MSGAARLPAWLTVVGGRDVPSVPVGRHAADGPLYAQMFLTSEADHENTLMKADYGKGVWSAWHSHPLGQILYILAGVCRVQRERGGGVFYAQPGDVVWLAPDEVHRHGADDSAPMSYLSVQGVQGGRYADWATLSSAR
jgi:quercetin dioxygenase-like cupin family protein